MPMMLRMPSLASNIEAIIAGSLTEEQRMALTGSVMEAQNSMVLPEDPDVCINFVATKFQALWRGYAVRNASGIFEKKRIIAERGAHHLRCPLTLEVFQCPVLATDSRTYELSAFLRAVEGITSYPSNRLGQGALVDNSYVLNRAIWEQSCSFRETWKMDINPLPTHLLAGSAGRHAANRAALSAGYLQSTPPPAVAPTPRAIFVPTTSIYTIMHTWPPMPLTVLFKTDGFLDEIRKPGLSMLLNNLGLNPALPRPIPVSAYSKHEFIDQIMAITPVNNSAETATILLDDENFIKHLTNNALDC
eukprot:11856775-Karenia_brevis.AAC.1